jgi:hypothetical protein
MDYRDILGITATIIAFTSYVPYIVTILKGTTKPHGFSWFVFGILMIIGFIAQNADGAGAGAWVTGASALICFIIAGLAVFKGTFSPTKSDWYAFIGSLLAIPVWLVTDNPVYAVLLITVIDILAFYPTIRKAYHFPNEELLFTYTLSGIKFILAFIALENISLTTAFYPGSLIVMNGLFITMVLWRRKNLG